MSDDNLRGRAVKAAGRLVLRLLLLAFAAVIVAALAVVIVIPRATHGAALTVLTGSMTPGIPVGSVVVIRPVDPATLDVGDVATYQVEEGEEAFITHRIVKIHDGERGLRFTFKGDANPGPDLEPIPAGAVRGEVWFHVPYLGGVRDALHGKGGVTLLAMLALFGYAISQVTAGLRERRSPSAQDASSSPTRIRIDRTLVLATVPGHVAATLGGLVLSEDARGATVLVGAGPDGEIDATTHRLHELGAISVEVLDDLQLLAPVVRHESAREVQHA